MKLKYYLYPGAKDKFRKFPNATATYEELNRLGASNIELIYSTGTLGCGDCWSFEYEFSPKEIERLSSLTSCVSIPFRYNGYDSSLIGSVSGDSISLDAAVFLFSIGIDPIEFHKCIIRYVSDTYFQGLTLYLNEGKLGIWISNTMAGYVDLVFDRYTRDFEVKSSQNYDPKTPLERIKELYTNITG